MPDETDAKKILTASPSQNWRRPPGRPCTTSIKTIQQDLKSNNLSMNEAVDVAAESPSLKTDVYIRRYSLLKVLARNG